MPETYDWVPWPPRYVDDDGRWHDWDDQILEGGMTYRELAFELASAQGLDIEEWLQVTGQLGDDEGGPWDDGY